MSLDGHDKLCGYKKATFPLCIYGGMDTHIVEGYSFSGFGHQTIKKLLADITWNTCMNQEVSVNFFVID